jgi:hypothetical protein
MIKPGFTISGRDKASSNDLTKRVQRVGRGVAWARVNMGRRVFAFKRREKHES